MFKSLITRGWVASLAVVLLASLSAGAADAARLGGGKSSGMQRNMPQRTSPNNTATPATPATPAAAPAATAATPAAAAAAKPGAAAAAGAAATARRSWMGPLMGLAAGLGLAALASHLGFGEEFATMMLIALAVMVALGAFAYFRARKAARGGPVLAGAASGLSGRAGGAQVSWPTQGAQADVAPLARSGLDLSPAVDRGVPEAGASGASMGAASSTAAAVPAAFVPAAFDSAGFERIARAIFIRMQTANDAGNLDDLRQFTTPEMYASIKLDLMERGPTAQRTEVQSVQAKVLDVADEADGQVVSVRYSGELQEHGSPAATPFDEVWHLVSPQDGQGRWLIAGIEQMG